MNKILFYNSLGENVLTLSQKYDETTDGEVTNINAFFACDDFSAELQTSTCEIEADLYQDFDFSNVESFKIFDKNNSLIGKFFPSNIENQRKNIYIIEGISSIGKLEEITITSFIARDEDTLTDVCQQLASRQNINFVIDETIKDDKIEIMLEDQEVPTAREVLQLIGLGNGYVISDFKTEGISIKPKKTKKEIIEKINFDNIRSDYLKENINQNIGTLGVERKYFDKEHGSSKNLYVDGYVKINNGKETFVTRFDDFILEQRYEIDGWIHEPNNSFKFTEKGEAIYIDRNQRGIILDDDNNIYSSDYTIYKINFDGTFSYRIDLEALQNTINKIKELKKKIDVLYTDENGEQYVLFGLSGDYRIGNYNTTTVGNIKLSNTAESNELSLYCAKDDIVSRLSKYYARKESINVRIKYDNFELGEIFKIYDIFKSKKYGILKELDLTFSYSNIFADCKLDILSDEEVQNIQTAKYGTAIYGVTRYGEEILN